MNLNNKNKASINLKASINVDTVDQDVYLYGSPDAPHIQNTGIERDGGITNIYEKETTYSQAGQYIVTDDGKTISVVQSGDFRTISINNQAIGQVSAYGVEQRLTVSGVDDIFLTSTSYVTSKLTGNVVVLTEYDYTGAQLNTRSVTFTNLTSVLQFFTSISIVKYNGQKYVDSQEWSLRLGGQVIILQESNPGVTVTKAFVTTTVLGGNQVNDMAIFNGWLVVAGVGGRVGSFDGQNWKNYDGSGTGIGIFDNANVIGSNDILKLLPYSYGGVNYLIVGGVGGRIGSYSQGWNVYTSGTAISNNATVISTDNVTAMYVWNAYLVVAGSAGKIGSWNGTAWQLYNSGTGISDNATVIGAVQINAMTQFTDISGTDRLVIAGASGRVGNLFIAGGITWAYGTTSAPAAGFRSAVYGNNKYVAVATTTSTTAGIAYSTNGTTWSYATTSAPANNWRTVGYGNGLFIAGTAGTSTTNCYATSTDGINWTLRGLPSAPGGVWQSITYGNGIYVVVFETASTTAGIATSPDGITWTFRTTTAPGGTWNSVTYGDGLFVAVAAGSSTTASIATSPDGITWTFRTTTAPGGSFNSVTYGNGLFVVTAATTSTTAGIATSTNGTTWTFRTTTAPGANWIFVTYGNGQFTAIANGTVTTTSFATSPDGITWTFRTSPTNTGGTWQSAAYGNGIFLAISSSITANTCIAYSSLSTLVSISYTAAGGTGGAVQPVNNATVIGANNILIIKNWDMTVNIFPSESNVYYTWQNTQTIINNFINRSNYQYHKISNGYPLTLIDNSGLFPTATNPYYTTSEIQTIINGLITKFNAQTAQFGAGYPVSDIDNTGLFPATGNPYYTTSEIQTMLNSFVSKLNSRTVALATGPYLTTIIINSTITTLVFAGAGGTIGSFSKNSDDQPNVQWKNYNSAPGVPASSGGGAGIYNNATVIGANNINSLLTNTSTLVVSGDTGKIGSYDGINFKNSDGTGTGSGPYSNQTTLGTSNITTSILYNSSYVFAGAASNVNTLNSTDFTFLSGFNNYGYLYTYRYENGQYLFNLVGNSLNQSFVANNTAKTFTTIVAKYCVPQISNGVTRHVVSATDLSTQHIYTGSAITCLGTVGYTDFATFSNTVSYPSAPYTLGNGNVLQSSAGFGYADFTFRTSASATNVYNYISQYYNNQTGLYSVLQGNTNTLINSYGRLTNIYGVAPAVPFEIRTCLVNGVQAYLSAALLDGGTIGTLGVMLTNLGEFDDTYLPAVIDDSIIAYKYNNNFYITKLGKNVSDVVQRIGSNVYKLNTLSPQNIINTNTNLLTVGSCDYNNRMVFSSAVAPTTSTKIASVIYDTYSNSVDTGDKLVTILNATTANYEVIGYRIPYIQNNSYGVDTFIDDTYLATTLDDGSELTISSKANTLYIPVTILPPAIGYDYDNGVIQTGTSTIFLNKSGISGTTSQNSLYYDGYSLGNSVLGIYTPFILYGGQYLFDGLNIYLANIQSNVYTSKDLICSALGMKFVGVSPQEAYFVSSFDNSIYTFNGGRTLNKLKRLNKKPSVIQGLFSTKDNTLVLETANSFIWVRDGIFTENLKKASQTSLKLYDTIKGIIIGNNNANWQYTYIPLSGSVVLPLTFQSAHFGIDNTQWEKSILSDFVFTIYNANRSAQTIRATIYSKDESDNYLVQDGAETTITVQPSMYNPQGYYTFRLKPANQRVVATSVQLVIPEKTVLMDAYVTFADDSTAVVSARGTR